MEEKDLRVLAETFGGVLSILVDTNYSNDITLKGNMKLLVETLLNKGQLTNNLIDYLNNPIITPDSKFDVYLFMRACNHNSVELAKWILRNYECDLSCFDFEPYMSAYSTGNKELVELVEEKMEEKKQYSKFDKKATLTSRYNTLFRLLCRNSKFDQITSLISDTKIEPTDVEVVNEFAHSCKYSIKSTMEWLHKNYNVIVEKKSLHVGFYISLLGSGDSDLVEWFESNFDVGVDENCIINACMGGNIFIIDKLYKKSKKLFEELKSKKECVLYTLMEERIDVIVLLQTIWTDFYSHTYTPEYMFRIMCLNSKKKSAKWLLENHPHLAEKKDDEKNLLFSVVCGSCDIDMLEWLLKIYDPIDIKYKDGMPFQTACEFGNLGVVKWLMDQYKKIGYVPDLNVVFKNACYNGYLEIAKLLVEYGSDTPLIDICSDVCKFGHLNILEWVMNTTYLPDYTKEYYINEIFEVFILEQNRESYMKVIHILETYREYVKKDSIYHWCVILLKNNNIDSCKYVYETWSNYSWYILEKMYKHSIEKNIASLTKYCVMCDPRLE